MSASSGDERFDKLEARVTALEAHYEQYLRRSLAIFGEDSVGTLPPRTPPTSESDPCIYVSPDKDDGVKVTSVGEPRKEHRGRQPAPEGEAPPRTPPTLELDINPDDTGGPADTGSDPPKKRGENLGKYLPEDWQPTDKDIAWVTKDFPQLNYEFHTEEFRDYWFSEAGQRARKRDWSGAWKNWMRKAAGRPPRGRPTPGPDGGPTPGPSPTSKRDALAARVQGLKSQKPEGYA